MTAAPWLGDALRALGVDHAPLVRYRDGQRARRRLSAVLRRSAWKSWAGDDDVHGMVAPRCEPGHLVELGHLDQAEADELERTRPVRSASAAPRVAPSMVQTDGGVVLLPGARPVRSDWWTPCDEQADRLGTCHEAWLAGSTGALPVSCRQAMCPACAAARAGRYVRRWMPVVDELVTDGHPVVLVTLTRPWSRRAGPVVLSKGDRVGLTRAARAWLTKRRVRRRVAVEVDAEAGPVGASSSSEPLAVCLDELRGAWRSVRNGTRSRAWWAQTTRGYVTGIEWTGSACTLEPGSRVCRVVPRWHAHLHALVILAPGTSIDAWREELLERWCELVPGADRRAQDVRPCDGRKGLAEVMKYPFKPASLTDAQVIEAWTTSRGLHLHQAGGALHGADARCKLARHLGGDIDTAPLSEEDRRLVRSLRRAFQRPDEGGPRVAMVRGDRWRIVTYKMLLSLSVPEIELRWVRNHRAADAEYGASVVVSVSDLLAAGRDPPGWVCRTSETGPTGSESSS